MSQQDVQQTTAINFDVAVLFDEIARRLEERRQNDFRVPVYRQGAAVLRELLWPADWMLRQDGRAGLEQIPGLGHTLARCIEQYVSIGRINVLEQLRGNPIVPWSCPRRMAGLEDSLADGRRPVTPPYGNRVPGGPPVNRLPPRARLKSPRLKAAQLKSASQKPVSQKPARFTPAETSRDQAVQHSASSLPRIGELLSIDAEYRREAAAGRLPKIAPKRFNPEGTAWLPLLHTLRFERRYTALFSNTAHAHDAQAIGDWVVVQRDDPLEAGHWTVITSKFGSLAGLRIVPGFEADCEAFYQQHPNGADPDFGRTGPVGAPHGRRVQEDHQLVLFEPTARTHVADR